MNPAKELKGMLTLGCFHKMFLTRKGTHGHKGMKESRWWGEETGHHQLSLVSDSMSESQGTEDTNSWGNGFQLSLSMWKEALIRFLCSLDKTQQSVGKDYLCWAFCEYIPRSPSFLLCGLQVFMLSFICLMLQDLKLSSFFFYWFILM